MFRRRVPFTQMAFAMLLGVAGGLYIYRPYFEPVLKTSRQQNQGEAKKDNETG
ncbi:protein PIGBOS1 [Paralichthys olivaceus]|uniref:protein PIGBOS1 n=1 Tax=Paralichthys olivaceus TaxID=8255 RepID=UPI00097DE3D7|nr:PREDICTED: protein PIGBOS1 [Paralichthys olivaceus]